MLHFALDPVELTVRQRGDKLNLAFHEEQLAIVISARVAGQFGLCLHFQIENFELKSKN